MTGIAKRKKCKYKNFGSPQENVILVLAIFVTLIITFKTTRVSDLDFGQDIQIVKPDKKLKLIHKYTILHLS